MRDLGIPFLLITLTSLDTVKLVCYGESRFKRRQNDA